MNQKKIKKIITKIVYCVIFFFSMTFCFLILFLSLMSITPTINDFFVGEKIIQENFELLGLGNLTSSESAKRILKWQYRNTNDPYNGHRYYHNPIYDVGIYKIDDKIRYFLRAGYKVSWFIKAKLGNCYENTAYFIEMMRRSGFESMEVKVIGYDHVFAAYINESNDFVYVEPSGNYIINESYRSTFANGKKGSKMIMTFQNGSIKDVTTEFYNKTTNITIRYNSNFNNTQIIRLTNNFLKIKNPRYSYGHLVDRCKLNATKECQNIVYTHDL